MMKKIIKINANRKLENKIHPSLFDIFQLGDRVKRTFSDNEGNLQDYSGIIMAIYNDSIDIFWDTINNKYQPEQMEILFENYKMNEIFNGNKNYSSIKKEKYIFKDIFKVFY